MTRQSIGRVRTYAERRNISATDTNVVMYTADENVTIRRIILYVLTNVAGSTAYSADVNFAVTVAPGGIVNESALNAEALADPVTGDYMGGGLIGASFDGPQMLKWETKGMRKLRKNDDLVFSFAGSSTVNGDLSIYADIFFGQ